MGIMALVVLLALETLFLVWSITTRNNHKEEKGVISIALVALFGLLLISGVFEWSFRYAALLLVLVIQALVGIVIIMRKTEKEYRIKTTILRFIGNSAVFSVALFLAILCPQYEQPVITGNHEVATSKYTWTDNSRADEFSGSDEGRTLTVEFWYPENADQRYPLVVFSHGAFGFSGSNYSTFAELASNGYVVASIGHTNQAFYTMDTNGKLTIVDTDFINEAAQINAVQDATHEEEVYNTTKEWMKLRTADESFIIDTILSECENEPRRVCWTVLHFTSRLFPEVLSRSVP